MKNVKYHTPMEKGQNMLQCVGFSVHYLYVVLSNHSVNTKYELQNCAFLIFGENGKQKELQKALQKHFDRSKPLIFYTIRKSIHFSIILPILNEQYSHSTKKIAFKMRIGEQQSLSAEKFGPDYLWRCNAFVRRVLATLTVPP